MRTDAELALINPCFVVDDVVASAESYRDLLGFHFDRFWGGGDPPKFVMVRRDHVQIMLREAKQAPHPTSMRPNRQIIPDYFDAYLYVRNVDTLYKELEARGAGLLCEPCNQPHDCREFEVADLNGYVLCFGQNLLAG